MRGIAVFLLAFFFSSIPVSCFAFSVSPSVADVSFATSGEVTQIFSVVNTQDVAQTYDARVQTVLFAADGSIGSFADVASGIQVSVDPREAVIAPGESGVFTVTFLGPQHVSSSDVFALILTENSTDSQEVSDAFAALIFPQGIASEDPGSLRIDAFTFLRDGADIRAVAQLTNTSEVLVRPVSLLVAQDGFGHEIGRFAFAQNAGRLPVGTTRVVSDVVSFSALGFWHLGGDVTFTLLSIPDTGGVVQQATLVFFTYPGMGVWIVGGVFLFFLLGIFLLLVKRRGILRS